MLYAVSDIHGYFGLFERLLRKVDYSPSKDQLIVLGDLIDRGPDSRKVIELCIRLQELGAIILKGNHEQMAVSCLTTNELKHLRTLDWLYYSGGIEMMQNYVSGKSIDPTLYVHIEWLKNLPVYYQCYGYTFVHGALEPGVSLMKQNVNYMLWGTPPPHCNFPIIRQTCRMDRYRQLFLRDSDIG